MYSEIGPRGKFQVIGTGKCDLVLYMQSQPLTFQLTVCWMVIIRPLLGLFNNSISTAGMRWDNDENADGNGFCQDLHVQTKDTHTILSQQDCW
jgi:hypothetical protein